MGKQTKLQSGKPVLQTRFDVNNSQTQAACLTTILNMVDRLLWNQVTTPGFVLFPVICYNNIFKDITHTFLW